MSLRLSWVAVVIVAVGALTYGSIDDRGPTSPEAKVHAIAATIKCPTCRSQSSAESDAPASRAIREEITRRVEAGESAGEIRAFFKSRYGEQILLTPSSSGLAGLVWVLPVAGVVAAGAGLGWTFWRWRRWA